MPVKFLSDDRRTVGSSANDARRAGAVRDRQHDHVRFFFFDDVDRDLVAKHRGEHNRLGFAVQMDTVRFLGMFLADPLDVWWQLPYRYPRS